MIGTWLDIVLEPDMLSDHSLPINKMLHKILKIYRIYTKWNSLEKVVRKAEAKSCSGLRSLKELLSRRYQHWFHNNRSSKK
jgi:hypothetical protein